MVKKWFNAKELKGLPGLPTSERGVLLRAQNKNWKSRPRKGLGGGSEFHISHLPSETRLYIEQSSPTIETVEEVLNSAQSSQEEEQGREEVKWFTTGELLKQPAGMPKTRQGIAQRAEREGWERREGNDKRIEFAVPPLSMIFEAVKTKRAKYRRRKSDTKLAGRLRKVRDLLNKNIPQMAKLMNVSAGAWGNYESGKTVPGANVLETLAGIGFAPSWLLTGHGEPMAAAAEEEKLAEFPVDTITTYEELLSLLKKVYNDDTPSENPANDLLFDAWIAAFSAVEDYCLYTDWQIEEAKKKILYVQLVREYLWGRNPYDNKRIAPQIVKNLFMLTKQQVREAREESSNNNIQSPLT